MLKYLIICVIHPCISDYVIWWFEVVIGNLTLTEPAVSKKMILGKSISFCSLCRVWFSYSVPFANDRPSCLCFFPNSCPMIYKKHFVITCQVIFQGSTCCRSVTKSCPTPCDPMNCSMPAFPFPSLSSRVCSNSRPLSQWCHPTISSSATSSSCFNISQHQGLFQWVGTSRQVAKILELQQQLFQQIFRVDFLEDWLV